MHLDLDLAHSPAPLDKVPGKNVTSVSQEIQPVGDCVTLSVPTWDFQVSLGLLDQRNMAMWRSKGSCALTLRNNGGGDVSALACVQSLCGGVPVIEP